MNTALKYLNTLADQGKAQWFRRYTPPNFSANCNLTRKYSARDADSLAKCFADYLYLSGYSNTYIALTGTYRADTDPSIALEQLSLFTGVEGRAVLVIVQIGTDRLSDAQKQAISDLIKVGASVYVARDFIGFVDWFEALLPTLINADVLPFGPIPSHQHH